jgi:2-polyprenyl-3-methyl-5-hydroxy-6-metoxy-1,4-benzoquinol methylase
VLRASRAQWANVTTRLGDRAAAAGLIKYKQGVWAGANRTYADEYERGHLDYLAGIDQVGQYSMLVGYIDFFGCRSILDVGCGHGVLRSRLDRVAFERYVGIDPVVAAIAIAQQYADARTEFVVGDVFLPQLGSFDAVVCCEVLYHIPELEAALDRIRALIKPEGYLLTSHLQHPRDAGLYRMLSERFELVSAYDLGNDTARGIRHRKVAAYRRTI